MSNKNKAMYFFIEDTWFYLLYKSKFIYSKNIQYSYVDKSINNGIIKILKFIFPDEKGFLENISKICGFDDEE